MTTRALYESLSFLASTWPKDKLRPDVNFGQSILKATEKCLAHPDKPLAAPPPQTSSTAGVPTRIDSKTIQYRDLSKEEEIITQNAIKALNSIKEGRASKQVCMQRSILKVRRFLSCGPLNAHLLPCCHACSFPCHSPSLVQHPIQSTMLG